MWKKKKENILVNYDGEPFYNCLTDEWLIDFEPRLKEELKTIIKFGNRGKKACALVAIANMTYIAILGFKVLEKTDRNYDVISYWLTEEHDQLCLPYTFDDMAFLIYRLGQLMTKHENVPVEKRQKIVAITINFMRYGGIDLIDELGDVFTYDCYYIEKLWNNFWNSGRTNYFKICKIFKSDYMQKIAYNLVSKVRWLDECIG